MVTIKEVGGGGPGHPQDCTLLFVGSQGWGGVHVPGQRSVVWGVSEIWTRQS